MAREVIIRIIGEPQEYPSASNPSSPNGEDKKPKANGKKKSENTFSHVMWAYLGKRAITSIKNEGVYYAGKYFTATDNYKGQELMTNAFDTVESLTSMYFAVRAGSAMFASTAIGGVAGGIIGLAVAAITKTAGAVKSYEQEASRITENAYGNYFYGVRAGLVAGGHGTEN